MRLKKMRTLIAVLFVFTGFSAAFGQTETKKTELTGNIKLAVSEKDSSASKKYFNAPIGGQIPVKRGDGLRIEFSETNKVIQLNWIAAADKNNAQQAFLNLTLMVSDDRGKAKTVKKKIEILKGQTKSFRIKNGDFYYEITAFYESENK
jgi:hypothetical protein